MVNEQIKKIISPTVSYLGYDLVAVELKTHGRKTLEIVIERQDRAPVTLEDCEAVHRQISVLLDVEDPIPGSYILEVSSPGIDRPLRTMEDYQRFAGEIVKLKTRMLIDGKKHFRGVLMGIEDGMVSIECGATVHQLAHEHITRARLDPEIDFGDYKH